MLAATILLLLLALVCAAIAEHSGRSPKEGFVLGLLLGPLAPLAIRDHAATPATPSDVQSVDSPKP